MKIEPPEVWYLMGYYRTPPTGGAYRSLMSKIDPEALEDVLREWSTKHVELERSSFNWGGFFVD